MTHYRLNRLVPAFFFLMTAPFARLQAQDPRTQIMDILHYDLALNVYHHTDSIAGTATIQFRPRKLLRKVRLDFEGMTPTAVSREKSPLKFRFDGSQLEIIFNPPLEPGTIASVTVSYTGIPQDGLVIRKNKYGRKTFFADNWPNRAHFWFPCVDHPSDKARVRMAITAPLTYEVVANGRLLRIKNNLDGSRTTVYETLVPIPTYCMVFGAAEFEIHWAGREGNIPLSFWVFPQDMADARQDFRRAGVMLNYFRQRFGPYPYAKLALVESSTRFGGMENASAIFFSERSLGTPHNIETTVAHEIAHQWFGNWVTPLDWQHLWLSEGFATYFGMQFFEYADGYEAFLQRRRQSRKRYLSRKDWLDRPIVSEIPEDLFELLNPNNYAKGAWVLHMLRKWVGEEHFWRGIRRYIQTYRGRNVTTDLFRLEMEAVFGKSLEWFFKQWVYSGGVPELEIVAAWNEQKRVQRITIRQKQPGPAMRLPVDIQFSGRRNEKQTVWLHEREETFNFSFPQKPTRIVIDPEVNILAKLEFKEVKQSATNSR